MICLTGSTKNCLSCSKPLKGRVDKKFCDDYCRSHYNNGLLNGNYARIRSINNILRRNRRILEQACGGKENAMKISKSTLLDLGFNFKFITHTGYTKKGEPCYFCYDYAYMCRDNGLVLVKKIN